MEFCEGGTLDQLLKSKPAKRLDEKLAVQCLAEMTCGLKSMHDRGTMHRDLKLENIFLDQGKCKIGDFGFATSKVKSNQYCGTP
mmetsp:Transcript_25454/g.22462  ORF Transcript_25454/g.22462 Transcript_25454/m.22462 type:complete len:84 (-) Transcript_25454:38-289(-)